MRIDATVRLADLTTPSALYSRPAPRYDIVESPFQFFDPGWCRRNNLPGRTLFSNFERYNMDLSLTDINEIFFAAGVYDLSEPEFKDIIAHLDILAKLRHKFFVPNTFIVKGCEKGSLNFVEKKWQKSTQVLNERKASQSDSAILRKKYSTDGVFLRSENPIKSIVRGRQSCSLCI